MPNDQNFRKCGSQELSFINQTNAVNCDRSETFDSPPVLLNKGFADSRTKETSMNLLIIRAEVIIARFSYITSTSDYVQISDILIVMHASKM